MPGINPVRNLNRLAVGLMLLLLLFAALFGWQAWRSEKADQINQLRTVLALGERAIDQYFGQLEASLSGLAAELVGPEGQPVELRRAHATLTRFWALHPDLTTVTLAALDGQVLATANINRLTDLPTLANEPSFIDFRAGVTPSSTMVLSRPLYGPVSRQWIVPLRYVLRDAQGAPSGFLVASLPVALLQTFWKDAPIVARASLGLLRDDGYLLSRYPLPAGVGLDRIFGRPRDGALRRHLATQGSPGEGYVEGANSIDGAESGLAFTRLTHYPVTLFVAMPMSEFRSAWWLRVRVTFALLLLMSLLGLAMYRYTLRQQSVWATQRKQSDDAVLASEREQRLLVDHLLAGVTVHDTRGVVLSANAHACRMLGLSIEQMRGHGAAEADWHLLHEDGRRMRWAEFPVARVLATRQPVTDLVIGALSPEGGEPNWAISNAYPVLDAGGGLRQVVVTFVDITSRIRTEHQLEQSESRYRMLFENSLDAVMQTRPGGAILTANPAACAMFGMTEFEMQQLERLALAEPADPRLPLLLADLARTDRASGELTMLRRDGSQFEAEISASVYGDESGQKRMSLVVRDVTHKREAEIALMAKELAEQANRAKSDFVARMSHELRTPLNAILGFSEVLLHDAQHPLTPDQQDRLSHVQRAGGHLLLLINDLLDLSRIEAGVLRVEFDDIDMLDTVRDAVLEVATQARARDVRINVEVPAGRPITVRGDRTRLRQVVLNLLSNAIKYNQTKGQVTLLLSADAARLQLRVRDSGLGLSPAQLGALFQPFNRLGRESSAIEGTGIGLVISRSLVELMGGTLTARSELGTGSEFMVELPLAGPAGAVEGAVPQPTHAHAVAGALASGRVLYIDDDEINRLLMQAFLDQRPDIELQMAADGRSGIALARTMRPDLVLIDLMMPGLSGLEVLKTLRADASLRAVPCLAVSANAMPAEISEALAAGFDGYLTKPLSLPLLLAEIDRRL